MQFEAPYAAPDTVVLLPNPVFGDSRALDVDLKHYQTLNGTRYTYIKTSANRRLTYTWEVLGRGKMLELEEFFQAYAGEFIKIIDHNSKVWKASIVEGASQFTTTQLSRNAGGPRTESGSITLEFIGCQKA